MHVKLKIMEIPVIYRHHYYMIYKFLHCSQYLQHALVKRMIDILFLGLIHCESVPQRAMHLSNIKEIDIKN